MNVLKTILYFSIFKYPLTKEELFEFTDINTMAEVDQEISMLIEKGIIFKIHNYFTDSDAPFYIERRLKGNKMAKDIMPKALKVAKFISKFPYVKSVSLSGALSKGYHDDDGDIDFFIITQSNRLWIARTLLILFKKVFLLNSKKYFCVNYFISYDSLKIPEQNRFTATEIATLIPIYGKDIFSEFIEENQWVSNFFPNKSIIDFSSIKDIEKSWVSKFIHIIFNSSFGHFVDELCRKITLRKWNRKFKHLEKADFNIAMKSTKGVSKHHPQNFQKKVIDLLNERYSKIETQYNLELLQEHA